MTTSTPLPRPSLSTLTSSITSTLLSCFSTCIEKIKEKKAESAALSRDPAASLRLKKRKRSGASSGDFGTFPKDDYADDASEASEEFDEFGGSGGEKITKWQAGWNVTNAIQGMFLVSLPYAVLHGGYWALLAMIGVAWICCYTGKILVDCLYEEDSNGIRTRVRDSYMSIAKVGFGERYGPAIVSTAQLIELLMTCILYVVLCGDLLVGTFPSTPINSRSWMMLTGIILLPCAFLRNLQSVSTLSFWCTVAHVLINLIIVAYCLACIGQWGISEVPLALDLETFPISLGIIVFSYTSHIFLPTLEGNMADPSEFGKMLDWSHVAAAAFKSGFGFVAFLTWRKSTLQVITNNLPLFWKCIVNVILVAKAILSYPLPYYAAAELIEKILFTPHGSTNHPNHHQNHTPLDGSTTPPPQKPQNPNLTIWDKKLAPLDPLKKSKKSLTTFGCIFRVSLVMVTILMAVTIPHFSILMGFIGNFTGTMLSFIWPCYFHLKLKGERLKLRAVVVDCFIIFLGVGFGLIGIWDSGEALVEAWQVGVAV